MKHVLSAAAAIMLTIAFPATAQDMVPGARFVENWDYDGDGQVSLQEATERRGDIFTTFDANEDNVLNAEEYDAFDEARAADTEIGGHGGTGMGGQGRGKGGGGMAGAAVSMDRTVSDLDKDGQVMRDEFVGNTPAWFAMRDRNGDGYITTADFGPGH